MIIWLNLMKRHLILHTKRFCDKKIIFALFQNQDRKGAARHKFA